MNRYRKDKIKKIYGDLCRCFSDLNEIHDKEEECYDNIPENLHGSARAEASEEAIESLENAANAVSEACDYLEGII